MTPDTGRIDVTLFMRPAFDVTEETPTSTFRMEQEVIKTRLTELYKYLDMTGNPDLVNLSKFRFKLGLKGATVFEIYKRNGFLLQNREVGFILKAD